MDAWAIINRLRIIDHHTWFQHLRAADPDDNGDHKSYEGRQKQSKEKIIIIGNAILTQ